MTDKETPPVTGEKKDKLVKGTLATLQQLLEKHQGQIASALPRHLTPERMIRLALTAVSKSTLLQKCDARTIAGCIVQSSLLGLEPDGALGEAYLVPFWNRKANNKKGGYEAQLMVGYQGLLKLVRNTDELLMVDAQAVHEKDFFEYEYGLPPRVVHKPAEGDRGPIVKYWAGGLLKGGVPTIKVMTVKEIEDHRDQYSKGAYLRDKGELVKRDGKPVLVGAWADSPDWMFKKTVLRQLAKLLPKSAQAQLAVAIDEQADVGLAQRFSADVPLDLHQTPADEDESEIAARMKTQTEATGAELREKLNTKAEEKTDGKAEDKTEGKQASEKPGKGGRKKKGDKDKKAAGAAQSDAPAESVSEPAQPEQAADGAAAGETEVIPDEYPKFTGNPQAVSVKDMPDAADVKTAYDLAKTAGVIPNKECAKLYGGFNVDELNKGAMAHFHGYLEWLQKRKAAETA